MATQPQTNRMAAGIVAFGPEPERLHALIEAIERDVERIFIYVNALIDDGLLESLKRRDNIEIILSPVNRGVGEGLNVLSEKAAASGHTRILLLDQDSRPSANLVEVLSAAMDRLCAGGLNPGAVGPRLVAPSAEPSFKAPHYPRRPRRPRLDGVSAVEFIATSGSLVDLAALAAIGPFRADFFIDAIDLEWGFRAWSAGYSIWRVDGIAMEHTIGGGSIRFFRMIMPDQKPFRMHAYLRNNVYGLRLPHVPLRWKLRQAPYLALQAFVFALHHKFDRRVLKALASGIWSGLMGNLGPPPGAALTEPEAFRSHPHGSGAGNGSGPGRG